MSRDVLDGRIQGAALDSTADDGDAGDELPPPVPLGTATKPFSFDQLAGKTEFIRYVANAQLKGSEEALSDMRVITDWVLSLA